MAGTASSLGRAGGDAPAASRPPQPGTQKVHQLTGLNIAQEWYDSLARETANQPVATWSKRKSCTVDAPASAVSFDPEVMQLLAAIYPCIDTDDQQQPASASAVGTLPAAAQATALPPACVPLPSLSPTGAPLAALVPPTSIQHVVPPGGTALWPDLQATGPTAGPALPLPAAAVQPGVQPSSPAGCLPAAAASPYSFGAGMTGAASPSLSAATAGNSFPGGPAAAPASGSGWIFALVGALPPGEGPRQALAPRQAGQVASQRSGLLSLREAAVPLPVLHPHYPGASMPTSPDPLSVAFWLQPAGPAAAVQPVGGPSAIGQSPLPAAATHFHFHFRF